jgi:hypothetical protein
MMLAISLSEFPKQSSNENGNTALNVDGDPQALKRGRFGGLSGTTEEVAEKRSLPKEQRPQGLKPELISRGLRGPEGPLFHG